MTLGALAHALPHPPRRSTAPTPPNVLPPLMVMGAAMGTIMPASMQTATLGVDRAVRRASPRRWSTRASRSAGRSARRCSTRSRRPRPPTTSPRTCRSTPDGRGATRRSPATSTAYWWGAGFFAFGAIMSALLFRRRGHGLSLAHAHRPAAAAAEDPAVAV